jgi:hypothetical protein
MTMTALLQDVFKKAAGLPVHLQDMLAKELLQEIEWESKWDNTLARSQSKLDKLTLRAMEKYKQGKTVAKGFDEL